jgi:transposase InsO family protein
LETYYVGTIKGVGRIYQQTFIDTYSKVAFAKLYDRKNALVAADLLNDRVLPFLEENNVQLLRMLTDRGTEYCGAREQHEYQLYLALDDIDHSRTKARHPQTNGICERFHKTLLDEFYSTAFRKTLYPTDETRCDSCPRFLPLCPDSPDGNHHVAPIGSDEEWMPSKAPCYYCGDKQVQFDA